MVPLGGAGSMDEGHVPRFVWHGMTFPSNLWVPLMSLYLQIYRYKGLSRGEIFARLYRHNDAAHLQSSLTSFDGIVMAVAPLSSGRKPRAAVAVSSTYFGSHIQRFRRIGRVWPPRGLDMLGFCSRRNPRSGLPDQTMEVSGASLPLGASFSKHVLAGENSEVNDVASSVLVTMSLSAMVQQSLSGGCFLWTSVGCGIVWHRGDIDSRTGENHSDLCSKDGSAI
jgi:hypothetical protein